MKSPDFGVEIPYTNAHLHRLYRRLHRHERVESFRDIYKKRPMKVSLVCLE